MTFSGLNRELCDEAVRLVLSAIDGLLLLETAKPKQGCLIILDPTKPWEPKYGQEPSQLFIDEVVLYKRTWIGGRPLENVYEEVAIAKAFASWMTGLPAQRIQQEFPHLFRPGWTKWGGSATDGHGGVVAFSGIKWHMDQLISEMVLAATKAVCLDCVVGEGGIVADSTVTFIPKP